MNSVPTLPILGPFDGVDSEGTAWVDEGTKTRIKGKLGIIKTPPPSEGGPPVGPDGRPTGPPGPGGPPKTITGP